MSLNSRLGSSKQEEEDWGCGPREEVEGEEGAGDQGSQNGSDRQSGHTGKVANGARLS